MQKRKEMMWQLESDGDDDESAEKLKKKGKASKLRAKRQRLCSEDEMIVDEEVNSTAGI